ncbi:MAG: histidinol phosphatase [Chloroflexi bacterium]|nr:histidinol phosphatase [Chloroflexota bacterium]
MTVDCHTHLQPHGEKPPMTRARIDESVRGGAARGVTEVCITEHLFRFEEAYEMLHGWWDDDPDPTLASMAGEYWRDHVSGSIADYVRLVEEAKSAGAPVLLGLEMDWIHGREETLRKFLAPYDWDIVLGSVHYVGAWGFDEPGFIDEWARRDVAGVWSDYAALVRELAESGLVDALSHPDLPKVFGHRPHDETPLHDAILAGAAVHGTAVELNSNGLRRCDEIYPAMPLLERAHGLGLPITLASDAHTPDRVGANFDELIAWARRAGYAEARAYVGRKAVPYAL